MLGDVENNLINIHIGGNSAHSASTKTSVNKYYNIFSQKMEEMVLPDIDLEFNAVLIPEKSTVMWTT